jgi:hypothetical protein
MRGVTPTMKDVNVQLGELGFGAGVDVRAR